MFTKWNESHAKIWKKKKTEMNEWFLYTKSIYHVFVRKCRASGVDVLLCLPMYVCQPRQKLFAIRNSLNGSITQIPVSYLIKRTFICYPSFNNQACLRKRTLHFIQISCVYKIHPGLRRKRDMNGERSICITGRERQREKRKTFSLNSNLLKHHAFYEN